MPSNCKHNAGFHFVSRGIGVSFTGWVCNLCLFELNFDPEFYPHGVAYLNEPNPKNTKERKLAEGGEK